MYITWDIISRPESERCEIRIGLNDGGLFAVEHIHGEELTQRMVELAFAPEEELLGREHEVRLLLGPW